MKKILMGNNQPVLGGGAAADTSKTARSGAGIPAETRRRM